MMMSVRVVGPIGRSIIAGSLHAAVDDDDGSTCSVALLNRSGRVVFFFISPRALQKRRDILLGADPRFRDDRNHKLMERLARQPTDGYAWNADHVTAVYQVRASYGALLDSTCLPRTELGFFHGSCALLRGLCE